MADIIDYLKWRGDLTFNQSPFNEIDNLILSQITYVNFDGIVPGPQYEETLPLYTVCDLFFKIHTEKEINENRTFFRLVPTLMKYAAETERFKNIRLGNYVNRLDTTEQKQFCALYYYLDEQTAYVAYRGTDDSLIGWKEDFNMSFMESVPSQLEAVSYLNDTAPPYKKLYIGGHSKGGNLAIYASVHCNPRIKENIIHIFNNDGPGFNHQMLAHTDYKAILPKITTIVPQSSIIGMLLEHEEDYIVIKSKQTAFMQHDAMSWETLGTHFVYCEELSKGSQLLDTAIKSWLSELTVSDRELFIETLYHIVTTTGAKTLSDLTRSKLKKINLLLKTYHSMDEATRSMLVDTIKKLTVSYYHVFKDSLTGGSSKKYLSEKI